MRESLRKPERAGWIILGAAMVASVVFLFWLQRDLAYADDSFNWLALSGIGNNKVLIEPYGGHLILTPLLAFKLILEIAGSGYTAMGVVQVALLLALSALTYEYGKRRVGPLLALPGGIIVLFLGSSWNIFLQPMIGIQFLFALVPGLAALLALEREDRGGDIACCLLLVLSILGFEMGMAFVAGAAVAIAFRGDRWRRAWIVLAPVIVYGAWKIWASKYPSEGLHISNLIWLPAYAVDSIGVVVVSLFGLFFWVAPAQFTSLHLEGWNLNRFGEGMVLLVFEVLAGFWLIRRLRRRGSLPASFWVAVAVLVVLWAEQALALSPERTPGEIRYVLPDTVAFLLVAFELARGVRATRMALAVAAALTVAAVVGNLPRFQEGRDILAEYSPPTNAAIAVMVLGGSHIVPTFSPAANAPEAFPGGRGPFIAAGTIQEIAAKYGSPGFSVAELIGQPEWVRRSADIVAAHALEVHTVPAEGAAEGARAAQCHLEPGAGESVTVPRGGGILVAKNPSPLLARRFGAEFSIEVGTVEAGAPMALTIPADSAAVPWRVQAPESGGLTACPL
jgi:hypothetical protein